MIRFLPVPPRISREEGHCYYRGTVVGWYGSIPPLPPSAFIKSSELLFLKTQLLPPVPPVPPPFPLVESSPPPPPPPPPVETIVIA